MKYELKELNTNMGKLEYDMYQEIPPKESGSTNLCNGISYKVFKEYLESQIARKYQEVSYYDTPTIIYIMYADNLPVGYIGIRTKIDDNWLKWCGNIYYTIRPSKRGQGYGTKMLELALKECRKLGFKEVFTSASEGNIASEKVIENNGGILLKDDGSKYYIIELE